MGAKSELFERLLYLDAAVRLPELVDQGIAISQHNGIANLLRKGLGIVAFNILEDFIKNRSYEALGYLSSSTIQFEKLTDSLQKASLTGAMEAVLARAALLRRANEDWKGFVQDEALCIHSTKSATFELSKYSFFSVASNISANEIGEFLKAFGIAGGWATLKKVSDLIGGGLPDPSQSYINAATRRHSAAHSAGFNYQYQWLSGVKNEILAISAAIDILLTARCRQVAGDLLKSINDHQIDGALKFRFLEVSGSIYRETTQIGGRAQKKWSDLTLAIQSLKPNLVRRGEFLIVLDAGRRIKDWHS